MRRRAQPWLGTMVEITIADPLPDAELNRCFHSAFAAIAEIHRLMSFHDPASDVARINRAPAAEAVQLDPHTYEVLRLALQVGQASGGIFDIACAPKLVECGYLPKQDGSMPDYVPQQAILMLDDMHRVRKSGALWIDLGGIAKGYAVDQAVSALKRCGIRSACVNAGGDLRVIGDTAFPVAIRNPRSPSEIGMQIELHDEALATSGNYFSLGVAAAGSALIDGRNGQACVGDFSVSVRAPSCALADALTKVVAASRDAEHAALARFGSAAFII